jgi:hypothetical protein
MDVKTKKKNKILTKKRWVVKNIRDEYDERYDLTKELDRKNAQGRSTYNCAREIALKYRRAIGRELTCTGIIYPKQIKEFEYHLRKFGVKYESIAYYVTETVVIIGRKEWKARLRDGYV